MEQYQGNIAILGSGNIGLSLAKGLVKANYVQAAQICLTRRNTDAPFDHFWRRVLQFLQTMLLRLPMQTLWFLAVLPQQLNQLLEQISSAVDPQKHLLISVASGVSCQDIRSQTN